MLLRQSQLDTTIANRRALAFIGALMLIQPFVSPKGWALAPITGFMVLSLGVYAMALRRYRDDPGLWMLAAFLFVLHTACYAWFQYERLAARWAAPAQRARNWQDIRLAIDVTLALTVYLYLVRFAITAALENWRRTRRPTSPVS